MNAFWEALRHLRPFSVISRLYHLTLRIGNILIFFLIDYIGEGHSCYQMWKQVGDDIAKGHLGWGQVKFLKSRYTGKHRFCSPTPFLCTANIYIFFLPWQFTPGLIWSLNFHYWSVDTQEGGIRGVSGWHSYCWICKNHKCGLKTLPILKQCPYHPGKRT